MNTTEFIRRYMRDHTGKMVSVTTDKGTVQGTVLNASSGSVWLVTDTTEDAFIHYDEVRGYSEKVVR